MTTVVDTAYLTHREWVKWNERLLGLERRFKMKRSHVESAPASFWGNIRSYKVHYETPCPNKRFFAHAVKLEWGKFPNGLSSRFK